MSDRLFVATRKGLFTLQRVGRGNGNGQWETMETQFLGEPVTVVLPDARDGAVYAALNLGHFGVKFWRCLSGGAWEECATPTYPPQPESSEPLPVAAPDAPPPAPWSLVQIWSLEAGGADEPGVIWAGTIPGGLFRSTDRGTSWTLNRPLWDRPERAEWFGGGYDFPGIHSVSVDPRDSRHVSVAISCGGVWQSSDGGESWTVGCKGMEAGYMPPERREDPNVQDPHRMVVCAGQPDALWVQHHDGIFRSTDGGVRWRRIVAQPSSFGFAVAVHPHDPDTAWFVPAAKDACRVPVDAHLVVTRTRDGGKSFETLDTGLPQTPTYDLIYRHGLDVDASGQRLAMASTTGSLWISEDSGDSWQCVSNHLPPVYAVRFG